MKKLRKTTFLIKEMDCPSEEQLIRIKLEPMEGIKQLRFNIPIRKLDVYHEGSPDPINQTLSVLDLGAHQESSVEAEFPIESEKDSQQQKLLWWVLGINFSFFIIEQLSGWISGSMGLIADSLDMLADAIVYGLSLLAVGAAVSTKKKVARLSGYFQMALAILGFTEVLRRFFFGSETPLFQWMIIVSIFALFANVVSLWIISRAKSDEAHMRASAIFTSNDIIVNGGVIVAGILVYTLASRWPDLLVGAIVFCFVMRGALRILKLSKHDA
ncbi:MAG: cation diffusion facilitator family transporter [Verrucomicrobiae bacterium]|nr:cation diffusion facilitator family transporter [Verrucomicrobiae bacterium]